ncbi:HTH-type transcriptional repressor YtrA [Bacillus sp. THAF10]|uniref:GntR family transcriptional regulator n=1 Tax=Bacillus sp. THAF10 TaxID=2587848 RepID=UPI00126865FE|nr:GntR family transcriptional regulator [Bacillus sp. THAF10]QFT88996.1 HTH-type transcriptional repressor YtrA [Bacillus sp. THAF10]
MILDTDGSKPIYMQIAEWLETEILNDHFTVDQKVYSQYQLAEIFNINPATAAKGLTMLVDNQVLYKKRGLGMFVTGEAKKIILTNRKEHTLKRLVSELVAEAHQLNVEMEELVSMIKNASAVKGEKGDGSGNRA